MGIVDVAKRAGVSKSTVSRVINGVQGPSEQTARAVLAVMEDLQYRPKPPGKRRGMRRTKAAAKRTGIVALLMLDRRHQMHTEIFAQILDGVSASLADNGLTLVYATVESVDSIPKLVREQCVDGLLLAGSQPSPEIAAHFKGIPKVWVTSHSTAGQGDQILAGNEAVAKLAVEYLTARGAERLAVFNPLSNYPVYNSRSLAFRIHAVEAGASARVLMSEPAEAAKAEAANPYAFGVLLDGLVDELIAMTPRPTGVFVPDDRITAMLYPRLLARGIRPAHDLEMVSCGNEKAYLAGLSPRPATIDLGPEIIGRRAVEQLIYRTRNPGQSRPVHLAVAPLLIEGGMA